MNNREIQISSALGGVGNKALAVRSVTLVTGTRIMIGTENGGRSAAPTAATSSPSCNGQILTNAMAGITEQGPGDPAGLGTRRRGSVVG
jgi:hypothetical protein